jgi:hypothetical protein
VYSTAARSLARLTLTEATPGSFLTARSTARAQFAHVMPLIGSSTWLI